MTSRGGLHLGGGEEAVRSGAGRGRVAVQAATVAGTSAFSAVAVDGRLQLTWGAQPLLLTLKGVEVLHIPTWNSFISFSITVMIIIFFLFICDVFQLLSKLIF